MHCLWPDESQTALRRSGGTGGRAPWKENYILKTEVWPTLRTVVLVRLGKVSLGFIIIMQKDFFGNGVIHCKIPDLCVIFFRILQRNVLFVFALVHLLHFGPFWNFLEIKSDGANLCKILNLAFVSRILQRFAPSYIFLKQVRSCSQKCKQSGNSVNLCKILDSFLEF